jgi:soluble lytic murein transglycosylase-like protein
MLCLPVVVKKTQCGQARSCLGALGFLLTSIFIRIFKGMVIKTAFKHKQHAQPAMRSPVLVVLLACLPIFSSLGFQAQAGVFQLEENGTYTRIDAAPAPLQRQNLMQRKPKPSLPRKPANAARLPAVKPAPVSRLSAARAAYFAPIVAQAAQTYGLSPALVDAVAHTESRYNPQALSPAQAIGIMQLMPGTARDLGVNPYDPVQNIYGGAAYLRMMLNQFNGNIVYALAAYNAGPTAVIKAGGVPPYQETTRYVASVLDKLAQAR